MKKKAPHDANDTLPVIPWYWRDWRASKARAVMPPEARGVYRELLDALWGEADCSLPNDDATLAGLAGVTMEDWQKVRAQVLAWFDEADGRLTNSRALHEWKKAKKYRGKARVRGRVGAKARWEQKKTACLEHASSNAQAMLGDGSPSPSPSPSPTPTNVVVGSGIRIPACEPEPVNLAIIAACREIAGLTGKEETEVLKAHSMVPGKNGSRPLWITNLGTASEAWRLRTHQDLQAELSHLKAPPVVEDPETHEGLPTRGPWESA